MVARNGRDKFQTSSKYQIPNSKQNPNYKSQMEKFTKEDVEAVTSRISGMWYPRSDEAWRKLEEKIRSKLTDTQDEDLMPFVSEYIGRLSTGDRPGHGVPRFNPITMGFGEVP